MSLNHVTLSGNLGKDSELRTTQSGLSVLTFTLCVNERIRQHDGTYADEPNWFDCVMFGNRAASLEPFLRRGSKISATGKLRQHKWEKDGKRHSRVEVTVEEVELMNTRREQQGRADPPPQTIGAASVYDDEIPF